MREEIFESLLSPDGRYAAVFEDDGAAAYFYLYEMSGEASERVLDHVQIYSGDSGLREADVDVRWDSVGTKAGLFIRGELWAYFDCGTHEKHGGEYHENATPPIARPGSFSN